MATDSTSAPDPEADPANAKSVRPTELAACSPALVHLAARVQANDTGSEQRLIAYLVPGLHALVRKYIHNAADAADLSQQCLLLLLLKLRKGGLDNLATLPGYLRAIAMNRIRQSRRDFYLHTPAEQISDPADLSLGATIIVLEREELNRLVRTCLNELSVARDREILVRCYLLEQEKSQICAELQLNSEHYDRVLHRAKTRLRALIDERNAKQSRKRVRLHGPLVGWRGEG